VADADRQVAELYDMIHPGAGDTSPVRSVFLIDPAGKVRLSLTYPKSAGRNFDEILRALDALQVNDAGPFSTPADWKVGERVIVAPTISTDDAQSRFEDVEEVNPYLRYAAAPSA
jgi:alkyl hydroperoxide reductase subunit AhpC